MKMSIFSFGLITIATAVGCGGTSELDSTEPAPAAATQEPILGTYVWSQGMVPVQMISWNDGFCFLTRISGKYEGWGESVYLTIQNGIWQLQGSSQQEGVGAVAQCESWSRFNATGGYMWFTPWGTQVDDTQWSQPSGQSNRFCYLAGMSGQFDFGGGEYVQVYKDGSTWRGIARYLAGTGTSVQMACIDLWNASGPVPVLTGPVRELSQTTLTHVPGQDSNTNNNSMSMGMTQPGFAAIQGFGGQLEGGGEYIQLTGANSAWTLSIGSLRSTYGGVHGWAGSVFYRN